MAIPKLNISVTDNTDLPPKARAAMEIVAGLKLAADAMKELGLTREQAVERAGNAIAAAWDGD